MYKVLFVILLTPIALVYLVCEAFAGLLEVMITGSNQQ